MLQVAQGDTKKEQRCKFFQNLYSAFIAAVRVLQKILFVINPRKLDMCYILTGHLTPHEFKMFAV